MPKKRSLIWEIDLATLKNVVATSYTYSEVLTKLNLSNQGGNYITLKNRLKKDNISNEHFDVNFNRQIHANKRAISIDAILVNESTYSRHSLKIRLIKEKILKHSCSECGLNTHWNNKPLSLTLDHINGVSNDNRLENLRFLCPNCHSQTDTFAGRNKKYKKHTNTCSQCSIPISSRASTCKKCSKPMPKHSLRKVIRPDKETLETLLWEMPTTHIASKFCVTDKAVEKWCKSYGLKKPPRGYWTAKN